MTVVLLDDQLKIGLIFMLSAKASQEVRKGGIISAQRKMLLDAQVNEDTGMHAGHTVENGLSEVVLPFAFPG